MCDALLSMKMSCFAFSSLSFPFCIILPVVLHNTGTFFSITLNLLLKLIRSLLTVGFGSKNDINGVVVRS